MNYSNSQRAGVILNFTAVLFGGYRLYNITAGHPPWEAFNSRPHKEVDSECAMQWPVSRFQLTTSQGGRPLSTNVPFRLPHLSTHDLTRRSTYHFFGVFALHELSTHDLTRRSTVPCVTLSHTLIFQLTTSQGGRHPSSRRT